MSSNLPILSTHLHPLFPHLPRKKRRWRKYADSISLITLPGQRRASSRAGSDSSSSRNWQVFSARRGRRVVTISRHGIGSDIRSLRITRRPTLLSIFSPHKRRISVGKVVGSNTRAARIGSITRQTRRNREPTTRNFNQALPVPGKVWLNPARTWQVGEEPRRQHWHFILTLILLVVIQLMTKTPNCTYCSYSSQLLIFPI